VDESSVFHQEVNEELNEEIREEEEMMMILNLKEH
jgi:hypothetical protein